MKKLSMIALSTLFANFLYSQDFIWAKSMGGTAGENGKAIAVDASGNVYTTGGFSSSPADFDPGTGVFNMGCSGCSPISQVDDIFITKFDASGNFIWAKQIGGTSYDYGFSMAIDATGNVYVTGPFQGTVDFDPGTGVFNLTSNGLSGGFLLKLNSSGDFVWAVQTTAQFGYKVVLNGGNVFVSGITSGSFHDVIIAKYGSNGSLTWEKKFIGNSSITTSFMNIDGSGNLFTCGAFSGTLDFDPGTGTYNLTSNGSSDVFLAKLDPSGNFVWAKSFGGANVDGPRSFVIGPDGNICVTGEFKGTVDMDPGAAVLNFTSNGGDSDGFISKFDPDGKLIWAKQIGGSSGEDFIAIITDSYSNIITTGYFLGTVDFDPGPATFNLTNSSPLGGGALFVCKLDPFGDFINAFVVNSAVGNGLAIDPALTTGGLYVTGYCSNTTDCDPGPGAGNVTTAGSTDILVIKYTIRTAGDTDWDGITDASDNCPSASNVAQLDSDGDNSGDACDPDDDNDGSLDVDDCAPLNPDVHPGATEICNNVDDNCNGQIDEGFRFYLDADNDGYGTPNTYVTECSGVAPVGYVSNGDDCYDQSANVHPGAVEVCNGTDDDCDGQIDEGAGQPTISPSGTVTICSGNSILLTSSPGVTHQWYRNNKVMRGETSSTLLVTASGGYKVKVTFTECAEAFSDVTAVNVVNSPAATISYRGNTDICSSGSLDLKANRVNGATYQWNKDAVPITGATQQTYTATVAGSYTVTVTKNGCSTTSSPVVITNSCATIRVKNTIEKESIIVKDFSLYPNPSSGRFKVIINQQGLLTTKVTIQVIDRMGRIITTHVDQVTHGLFNKEITIPAHVADGIYLVRINTGDKLIVKKLVIAKND